MEYTLGQTINVVFVSQGLITGLLNFPDAKLIVDGNLITESITYSEIGNGLYNLSFNSSHSGTYSIFIQGGIQATFSVVLRDKFSFLKNIEDEALGSWTWNKITGEMSIIRQDSTVLGTFTILDTTDSSSRERIG